MRFDLRKNVPLILLAAFSVVMVWPLLFQREIYFFRDFGRFFLPVKEVFIDHLRNGEFPLWLPEINCGTPVHGELVHGLMYPGNVLLLVGGTVGWGLYFAAHLLLAGAGARALARHLGAEKEASLAAGIAFAGSGYLVSQLNHVPYATAAAWAPWIIWLGLQMTGRYAIPGLAVAFAMAALAGEPFTLLLTILFLAILLLAGHGDRRLPSILRIGLAGGIAILLASPALLPAYEQIAESGRATALKVSRDGYGSLWPFRLGTLLSPEGLGRVQHSFVREYHLSIPLLGRFIAGYAPPILLAIHLGAVTLVGILLAPVRRFRSARTLAIVIVVFTVLALGSFLYVAVLLMESVPGFTRFRYPDKFWFVVTLAAAPLLALALPRLRARPAIVVSVLLALSGFFFAALFRRPGVGLVGTIPFVLVALSFRLPPVWRARGLILILAVELLFFGLRLAPTTDPAELRPRNGMGNMLQPLRPGRIFVDHRFPAARGDRDVKELTLILAKALESIGGIPEGYHYTMGYDPVEPLIRVAKFYGLKRELESEMRTKLFHRQLRLTANTHSITTVDLRGDPEVEHVIDGPEGIRCYAYRDPKPRARLYGSVRYVPDVDAARELLHELSFDPFSVLLIEGEGESEEGPEPRGEVKWLRNGDREVVFRVKSDRPAWLLLTDSYANGWRAWVDGEPEKIEIALIAFRAVRVPAGESEVTFRYEPRWLRVVPVTAGLGLVLLFATWWVGRRRGSGPEISASDPGTDRSSSADGR